MLEFHIGGHDVQEAVIATSLQCTLCCSINLLVGMSLLHIVKIFEKYLLQYYVLVRLQGLQESTNTMKKNFSMYFSPI